MEALGRLFPFIIVIMENIVHQCYNSNDQDTVLNQIWPSYVFHITHSLSGSRNRPPTVSGMPSVFYYITLCEKCQTIVFVFCKNKYRLFAIVKQKRTWQTSKKCVRKESLPVQQTICSHAKGSASKQKNAGQCRRFLLPGKEMDLNVIFHSAGRNGKQRKVITLFCNDPRQPTIQLIVKGEVKV